MRLNFAVLLKVPGCEWAVFKLGCVGTIDSLIIDTTHFKGNFPDNAKVEGALEDGGQWRTILSTKKVNCL